MGKLHAKHEPEPKQQRMRLVFCSLQSPILTSSATGDFRLSFCLFSQSQIIRVLLLTIHDSKLVPRAYAYR